MINASGNLVRPAIYDAIGEFKHFGYAVMQRSGGVGLLARDGKEMLPPRFEDIKVLDSVFIAVLEKGVWKVVDMAGRTLLPPGYEQVLVLRSESWKALAFRVDKRWGLVSATGVLLRKPEYDNIAVFDPLPEWMGGVYLLTENNRMLGLLDTTGQVILPPVASEIRPYNERLFFAKQHRHWGAVDAAGHDLLPYRHDYFIRLSDQYIKLVADGKIGLFSLVYNQLLAEGEHDNYYPFSAEYALCKKNNRMGLIDHCGNIVLAPQYNEVQQFNAEIFRVNKRGKWGLATLDDEVILPFEYDYLSPVNNQVAIAIKDGMRGVVNDNGHLLIAPVFDQLDVRGREIRALANGRLTLFHLDEMGYLQDSDSLGHFFTIRVVPNMPRLGPANGADNPYLLQKFEWYYSTRDNKWGLRRLDYGTVQIEPSFDEVRILPDIGLTLVGIQQWQPIVFDRTSFRLEMAYGLVQNDTGLLVHDVSIADIRLADFDDGLPAARCVFTNGRHGLVNRIGKVLVKDFAYIGEFHDGVARASTKGYLSCTLKPADYHLGNLKAYLGSFLVPVALSDYTQYDLDVESNGWVICEEGKWGYIDTLGNFTVAAQYDFAQDFVNDVGIVAANGKWGMVNKKGKQLLPCQFDEIGFLENSGNTVLRIFKQEPKYGLIDSLGRLTVDAQYDNIGSFSEGRLAVMCRGRWGFVDRNGLEVIPCRFDEVSVFNDGLAAVRIGSKWGYIDRNGNTEIDLVFSKADAFGNGLAPAKSEGPFYGYINRSGQWVIAPQYPRAHPFDRGVAVVEAASGEYIRSGLIDTLGNAVSKPRFVSIRPFNAHGLAVVELGGSPAKYALLTNKGQLITSDPFRFIGPFREGLARVQLKESFGFIDTTGRLAIPPIWNKASDFSEGKAAVWIEGRCGFINCTGELIVEPQFIRCMDFHDGKAIVFKNGRQAGLIDHQGNLLIEPGINRLIDFSDGRGLVRDEKYQFYYITEQARFYDGYYENAGRFRHGMAVVKVGGRWAVINQQGIEVIPPKYDQIGQFENGFAKVRIRGFSGLTNLQGEPIIQPDYEYISYAGDGLFRVEQGDKIGYFDSEGRWVWGLQE